MSRIGKLPIELVKGVSASVAGNSVTIKGPKGELHQTWNVGISVTEQDGTLVVARDDDSTRNRAQHGLTRSLIQNMVTGVSQGYSKKLEINGVGFRAESKGNALVFHIGYTLPVEYTLPDGVSAKIEKGTQIEVAGIDKQKVGQAAADIRSVRLTDPYKLKGIKYTDEVIKKKVGKASA
jgi:large subunit ribosomal protein L6